MAGVEPDGDGTVGVPASGQDGVADVGGWGAARSIRPGPVKVRAKSRRCQRFSPMWTLVGWNSEWTQPNGSSVTP